MHGARAALGNAAAIFWTGDAQLIPESPEKRHLGLDVHVIWLAVDCQFHRERSWSAVTGQSACKMILDRAKSITAADILVPAVPLLSANMGENRLPCRVGFTAEAVHRAKCSAR